MTALKSYVTNATETNLSGALGVGVTTINIVSSTGFPAVPFYAVLEPSLDAKREVVLVTAKTAITFTVTRGQDGTTDTAHDSGVVIKVVPVAAHINDLHDRVDAIPTNAYVPGGTDVPVSDGGTGASTPAGARTNLGLVIGTDVQGFDADLAAIAAANNGTTLAATTAPFTTAKDSQLAAVVTPTRVVVSRSGQAVPTGATTAISFATEVTDPSNLIVVPSADVTLTSGVWVIFATVSFASNATGVRYADITGLSSTSAMQANAFADAMYMPLGGLAIVPTTQVVRLRAYQTSGGSLSVDGFLSAARIGDA